MTDLKFFVHRPSISRFLEVAISDGNGFAEPLIFTKREEWEFVRPTFSVSPAASQELMDELWRQGVRPTSGAGSEGHLNAVEKHNADLRTIAFHALKIGGKP